MIRTCFLVVRKSRIKSVCQLKMITKIIDKLKISRPKQKKANALFELRKSITEVIHESFSLMASKYYTEYILFIGRADTIQGLKKQVGTDCIIDYHLDTYYDKTRTVFYLHYLNRNYRQDGFSYQEKNGIDDLNIELMIYCHLWDSSYFIKSLCRIASIVTGNGYIWYQEVPWIRKDTFMRERIIEPLKEKKLKLGELVEACYNPSIRNAFAHALYTIDEGQRVIHFRPQKGPETLTFNDFQKLFLKSVMLMNLMENILELNHQEAAKKNGPLTKPFLSPDGIKLQVYGNMVKRGSMIHPEFQLVKVK